ncbi:MAG: isoleucine--tRNA ligase, partial [Chloroflexota bacterium]|nr:isoleucine--tRNA ligase [Chloroflexota bacterium]
MFEAVESRVSFPELERRILQFWRERRIFERSVEERPAQRLFVLYEGPPTANASPGVHHVLSRVFKDVIPRYKTMQGYRCPRKAGWDTHGLPVELEIERELGLSSKAQIEAYGVAAFNERCRQSVFRYVKEWDQLTERIGFWVDTEHPYITLENAYIETCWWVIKQLWDRGLVYQGYRVTPHCPRCGTSLSSHEVALGYADTDDPSVYVKFRVTEETLQRNAERCGGASSLPTYLLAWTTTPWTLPGNTALAVAPDADYSVLEGEADRLIVASALVEAVVTDERVEVARVKGSAIADAQRGLRYEPLFNPHEFGVERRRFQGPDLVVQGPDMGLTYPVIGADFVSLVEGSGVVHVAPSFGEVDFEAGAALGLDLVRDYVDLQGVVQGGYPFAGRFVKEADGLIIEGLKERGRLYRSERLSHSYPFCWRCHTPLLYYAKPSWYIKTTARKERLIAGNEAISWYPEHIKRGRFGDWLANNVDWAVSRERYWGTPLPVWRCASCGAWECVGGLAELATKEGLQGLTEDLDLHRPYVDEVSFSCGRCGGEMRRCPEVLDAWFDSGAMPVAQWHYPFENEELFDRHFPADYICEAVDQTRGWFYTLHALSVLLFDRPCFRNVICLGHILDAQGEKMSKSRGNVVEPWQILEGQGADALRWYLLTASPAGMARRFSAELVGEAQRRFLLTLWNVYSFFVTYATIDRFDPRQGEEAACESELDRWVISELNLLVDGVTGAFEGYNPTEAGRKIAAFVDELSNWYVRRSRRRFWKSESDADKLSAYHTLYRCLVTLCHLLAPLTPFVAEEMYRNLVLGVYPDGAESVHLAPFPVADLSLVDERLSQDVALAMKVSSMGRAARSQAGIKVRQPLEKVVVWARSGGEREGLMRVRQQVIEELNVKGLELAPDEEGLLSPGSPLSAVAEGGYVVAVPRDVPPHLADEGLAREIVHRVQTMRKQAGFDIADYIQTSYRGGERVERVMAAHADYIRQETLSRELVPGVFEEGAYVQGHRIDGEEVELGVRRVPAAG